MIFTEAQKAALDTERSTVVVAGAGSGKTTVLVERYLATLQGGVPGRPQLTPADVVAITFTEAAARNLKRRVLAERPDLDADDAPISTIHAFAARLLRMDVVADAAGLGADGFRVVSPLARRVLSRNVIEAWWDNAIHGPNVAAARVAGEWNRATIVRLLEALAADRGATERWLATVGRATPDALEDAWQRAYADALAEKAAEEGARRLPVFAEVTVALAVVAREVLAAIEAEKARHQLLDHDDLLTRLDRALDAAPVQHALGDRFAAVLVDEYQDVDPTQRSIIAKLVGARDGRPARPGALFVVGDPKQAIYRFRGARPAAFDDAVAMAGAGAVTALLSENFRSVAPLLSVLNTVTSGFLEAARREGLEVPPPQPLAAFRAATCVFDEVLPDPVTAFTVPARDDEMRAVAHWIAEARARGVSLASIAVLLRDRTNLAKLERALADFGVPARVLAAGGFFRSAVARDFTNLLAALVDPADDIAFLGFLRGPLCGLSDDALAVLSARGDESLRTRVLAAPRDGLSDADARALALAEANLARWTALSVLAPIRALIADVLRSTAAEVVYAAGAPDSTLHVTRLVRLADATPALNAREFLDLLRANLKTLERDGVEGGEELGAEADGDEEKENATTEAQRHRVRKHREENQAEEERSGSDVGAGGDAVSVLTIHAAKGLEFPIVVVPGLARPIERAIPAFKCVETQTPTGPRTELLLARKELFAVRAAVSANERREEVAESLRVLYVAFTRACDRLVLFLRPGVNRDSWARRILPMLKAAGVEPRIYPQPHLHPIPIPLPLPIPRPHPSPLPHPRPVVSPSALHLLAECPLRYKFAVVLGIPEPRIAPPTDGAAGVSSTVRGSIVHRAFESNDVGERALATPFQAREVAVEFPFEGLTIRGAIDFAYGDPATGAFGVIDFKTDRVAAADVAELCTARGYDLQLALYAHAIRDAFHAKSVDAHLFFTEPGSSARVGFSATELDDALRRVRELLLPILAGEFSASASPPCARCGFGAASLCPSRR